MPQNSKVSTTDPAPHPVKRRMKPEARKLLIAQDAARLFAARGFSDVGFRELAKFCDVSEPLLYRYFPRKEDLWQAALSASRDNVVSELMALVVDQLPSTRALIRCTVALASEFCRSADDIRTQNRNALHRMVLRSLAEDGAFAKIVTADLSARVSKFVADCLHAAEAAGDVSPMAFDERVASGEFYVHLFFMVGAMRLPTHSPGGPDLPEEDLIAYLVKHQLRALGLPEALVRKELQMINRSSIRQNFQLQIPDQLLNSPRKR